MKVAIADINLEGIKAVASQLGPNAIAFEVNIASWDSQVETFKNAVDALGGRVDHVFPIAGIGERPYLPNDHGSKDFVKPDLAVLDVDLNGLIYTSSLAIQQMRRQDEDERGFRGKSAYSEIPLIVEYSLTPTC